MSVSSSFRDFAAVGLLAALVLAVAATGFAVASVIGGPLAPLAGLLSAAAAAQALRRPVGRAVGALVDGV